MGKYWILIAALAAAACARHEVETAPENPASGKVWTVEVDAARSADDATKALGFEDGYLYAYWSGTDKVEVYDGLGVWHLGTLLTPGGGRNCHFSGTISGSFNTGDVLTLAFPDSPSGSPEMYAKQKGTLEDIAKRFDYAIARATVESIDEATSAIRLADAAFTSRQSISLFSFSYTGSETNRITTLTITSCGLNFPVTVIPDTPGTEFFVAIPGKYGAGFDRTGKDKIPYDFVAETEDGTVFSGTMKALLEDGKFYKASKYLSKYESAKQPLTIEALRDGTVTIQNPLGRTFYYGFEGVNGSTVNSNIASGNPVTIEVKAGDKLLLGGDLSSVSPRAYATGIGTNVDTGITGVQTIISADVPHYVYGNVMSLIHYSNYQRPDLNSYIKSAESWAFAKLFYYDGNLRNHPVKDIELPAEKVSRGSYSGMFGGCVNLTRAPELPATTFTGTPYSSAENSGAYQAMFAGCQSLVKAPSILPASTVPDFSYYLMFSRCFSLKSAPVLPAKNPGAYAYGFMFENCRALKQITCYAKSNIGSLSSATRYWVKGISEGGSFISDPSVSWPSGEHGIPAGWNGFVDPLTIEALEDGTVTISNPQELPITYGKDIHLSMATTSSNSSVTIDVSAGDKVRLWGDNQVYGHESAVYLYTTISCSGRHNVSGDIRSLISSGDYVNVQEIADYAFVQLFFHDEKLVSAKNLVLGAGTVGVSSYESMFEGCTAMTSAPALPATNLAEGCYANLFAGSGITGAPALPATTLARECYAGMFRECQSLTSAPALPATTLAEGCYMNMFDYCTSLTTAPALNAPTLVRYCYAYMFRDCSSLGALTCLATNPDWDRDAEEPDYDAPNAGALSEWMSGVKAAGTFTRKAGVTWPRGDYGVPSGWTVTP
ncbi:MAG: hypothetical protein IJS66_06540 [Bacteroidales bacterium]|nr:hypothetical protein [Bacteroidales bacterium]